MKPLEPEIECEFPLPVGEPPPPNVYIPTPISMIPVEMTGDVAKAIDKEVESITKEKNDEYESLKVDCSQKNALKLKEFTDIVNFVKAARVEAQSTPTVVTSASVDQSVTAATGQTTTTITGQTTTTVTVDNGVKTTVVAPTNLNATAANNLADLLARSKLLLASLAAK